MVTTVGGICGTPGFLDGPLGVNKLNSPGLVGTDEAGNIFVMDSGNRYVRIIDPDGYMKTLINGACFETGKGKFVQNVNIPETICYKSWIKKSGMPNEHIYIETQTENETKCLKHMTQCEDYIHPLYRKFT